MALITQVGAIKNRNYSQAQDYLENEHEEIFGDKGDIVKYEPKYNDDGELIKRENYAGSYLTADGEKGDVSNWNRDCKAMDLKYHKNQKEDDVRARHYVISYPEEDKFKNGLTVEQAQKNAEEMAKKLFPGHNVMIYTHGDTDNIHSHLVVHSLHKERTPENWMEKNERGEIKKAQYAAGGKHHDTKEFMRYANEKLLEMTKEKGLKQEDWNKVQDENKKLRRTNAIQKKEYLHESILKAAEKAKSEKELIEVLKRDYGIEYKRRNHTISVKHPEKKTYDRLDRIGLEAKDLTPDLHRHQDDDWKKPEGYELTEKARQNRVYLHEAIIKSVEKSKNEEELIKNLRDDYGVKFIRDGAQFRVYHPRNTIPNKMKNLGITPKDLTEDLHKYYKEKRDKEVKEKWENRYAERNKRIHNKHQQDAIQKNERDREKEEKHKLIQKEREEYERTEALAERGRYFALVYESRYGDKSQGKEMSGPSVGRSK